MEENFEIVDLVQQCLENDGVLRDIRSQLRASVFKAIMKTSNIKKTHPVDEFAKTARGELILGLVNDVLEILELKQTQSVFLAEAPKGIIKRSDLLSKLKLKDCNKTPIVQLLLQDLEDKVNKPTEETAPIISNNYISTSLVESKSIDKVASVNTNRSTSGRLRSAIKSYGSDEFNDDNYTSGNNKNDVHVSSKSTLSPTDDKESNESSLFPTKNEFQMKSHETIKLSKLTPLPSLSSSSSSKSNISSQPKDEIKTSGLPVALDNSTSSFEESDSEIGLSTSSTLQAPRILPIKDHVNVPPPPSNHTIAGSHIASERIQQFDLAGADEDDDDIEDFDQSLEIDDSFAESSFNNNHNNMNSLNSKPNQYLPKKTENIDDTYSTKKTIASQNIWDTTTTTASSSSSHLKKDKDKDDDNDYSRSSTKEDKSPEVEEDEVEVEDIDNDISRNRNSEGSEDGSGSEDDFNYTTNNNNQKKKINNEAKLPESSNSNSSTSKSRWTDRFLTEFKSTQNEAVDNNDFHLEASEEDLDDDDDVSKTHAAASNAGTISIDESSSQDPLQTSHRSSNQDEEEEDIDGGGGGGGSGSRFGVGAGKSGKDLPHGSNPRSPQDSDGGGAYGEDEDFEEDEEEDPELSAVEEEEVLSIEESLEPSQEDDDDDDMSAGGGQDSDDDKDIFGNKRPVTKQSTDSSSRSGGVPNSSLFSNSSRSALSTLPALGRGTDSLSAITTNKKHKEDDEEDLDDDEDRLDSDRGKPKGDHWTNDNSKSNITSNSFANRSGTTTTTTQFKKPSNDDDNDNDDDLQSISGESNELSVGGADSEDEDDASQGLGKGGIGDSVSMDFSVSDQEVSSSGALNDYDYTTTNMKTNKGKFSY